MHIILMAIGRNIHAVEMNVGELTVAAPPSPQIGPRRRRMFIFIESLSWIPSTTLRFSTSPGLSAKRRRFDDLPGRLVL